MQSLAAADTNTRHITSARALYPTFFAAFCLLLSASLSACGQTEANLPGRIPTSQLPVYELKIDPKALAALDANPDSNDTQPATFIAEGTTYEKARVRYRGDWARSWPKKPLKILFNDNQLFQGHHSVNLNSAWRDAAFIRETLAYQVYAACGVPAPQSRLVRLDLNGAFRGVYVEVEQVDKVFLRRVGLKGATIYKTDSPANQADERDLGAEANYPKHYERETQEDQGHGDLQQFCRELARSTNALEFFTTHVDLDKYVNFLAATALVQNWDCFNKNHYLVRDSKGSKKWLVVPWDLDRTFGDHWGINGIVAEVPILQGTKRLPGPTGWNRMMEKFFSDPILRDRFAKRLRELLETEFTSQKLFPVLDQFEKAIAADAARDRQRWRGTNLTPQKGISQLRNYIERRRNFLLKDLQNLRTSETK
jgi:spore coat protein CotH